MEHNPNDPMCKCEKCMTKGACTADSPDCGDEMCKVCAMKKSEDVKSIFADFGKNYTRSTHEVYQAEANH